MPRPQRIQFPGARYHVSNRGGGGRAIFETPADAADFLGQVAAVATALGWRCQAYCLMPTHYHLVLETAAADLSHGMQRLAGRYTQAFNRRHGRDGQLFRGRFRALLVERETHLAPLVRYVALAPVLDGLAPAPEAWRWSSHRAMAGLAAAQPFLDTNWLSDAFGAPLPAAQAAWRAYVAEGAAQPEALRRFAAKFRYRSILGSRDFARRLRGRGA